MHGNASGIRQAVSFRSLSALYRKTTERPRGGRTTGSRGAFFASAVIIATAIFGTPIQAEPYILYAGSYTDGTSKGIYAWRFESSSGALEPLGLAAAAEQPAHLWASPDGRTLYAVNWLSPGAVSAYRIERPSGHLTLLNKVSSEGDLPNQIVLSPDGRVGATVNYATGTVAVYGVEKNGSLMQAFYVDRHTGTPRAPKQPGARAHGAAWSRDSRRLYIAELGLDRVYVYHVDPEKRSAAPASPPYAETQAGAGPRRLQLSADERFLYANHETDSAVSVFRIDGDRLEEVQVMSTMPPDSTVQNSTAEILLDPSGRHLYVSNRGLDTIVLFDVATDTGRLTFVESTPSGGSRPRNIRIDPTGNFLLSANEGAGNITVFRIDRRTGRLTSTPNAVTIDRPGGLYLVNAK